MSKEMREHIDKFRQFINENYNDEYNKALKDVNVLIPLISHEIIHENGLEHTEENMIKLNREIKQKVESGDDYVLDKMWDLAGSAVLKHAINVITHYHKNN
jgi:hypothetical protein